MLAIMFHIFRTKNHRFYVQAYTSYVRSLLEYAPEVWNPLLKGDIERIEKVQHSFTRRLFARCKLPKANYDDRLKFLKLNRLENRRIISELSLAFKIFQGNTNIKFEDHFTLSKSARLYPLVRTKMLRQKDKRCFFNRVSVHWNALARKYQNLFKLRKVSSFRNTLANLDPIEFYETFINPTISH